ncbi:MAG TPA: hypothetical protein VH761_08195 [Ilumatobacteraceae bacterium]|jgi:hypothetical protein
MRLSRRLFVASVVVCAVLGACSDDKPSSSAGNATVAQQPSSSSASEATSAVQVPGDVDCAALKDALANLSINWQVVIGLTNSPSAEWAQIPIGSVDQFGDELAVVTAGLGNDADAAAALSYMSGANDIVVRGLGGDETAQGELTNYLGTDITANVGKQLPISIAYQNAGCE